MSTHPLKITAVISVLLFLLTGCSFYARIGSHDQGPQQMSEMTESGAKYVQTRTDVNGIDLSTNESLTVLAVRTPN